MSYKPTPDEFRVIAYLRKRAQTASTWSGKFYFDAAADAVEGGLHHDDRFGEGARLD